MQFFEALEEGKGDADEEIEAAAGCSIEEYFLAHGEAEFRDGVLKVTFARKPEHKPRQIAVVAK